MSEEYLLDTGVLNAFLRGRSGAIALVNLWVVNGQASTSILVYGEIVEVLQGRSDYLVSEAQLRQLLLDVRPYYLDYPILRRYAQLRRDMRQAKIGLIGDVDTLIAATALQYNLTVVTIDSDFTRVPGLKVMLLPRATLR